MAKRKRSKHLGTGLQPGAAGLWETQSHVQQVQHAVRIVGDGMEEGRSCSSLGRAIDNGHYFNGRAVQAIESMTEAGKRPQQLHRELTDAAHKLSKLERQFEQKCVRKGKFK